MKNIPYSHNVSTLGMFYKNTSLLLWVLWLDLPCVLLLLDHEQITDDYGSKLTERQSGRGLNCSVFKVGQFDHMNLDLCDTFALQSPYLESWNYNHCYRVVCRRSLKYYAHILCWININTVDYYWFWLFIIFCKFVNHIPISLKGNTSANLRPQSFVDAGPTPTPGGTLYMVQNQSAHHIPQARPIYFKMGKQPNSGWEYRKTFDETSGQSQSLYSRDLKTEKM